MKHDHCHCSHTLRFCERCDSVYCTKCNREWGSHSNWRYNYPYFIGRSYTTDNPNITYTTDSNANSSTQVCIHNS